MSLYNRNANKMLIPLLANYSLLSSPSCFETYNQHSRHTQLSEVLKTSEVHWATQGQWAMSWLPYALRPGHMRLCAKAMSAPVFTFSICVWLRLCSYISLSQYCSPRSLLEFC